ncbi:MAG: DUF4358 domain-containing protein [Oscillospiraceae bacterium]|nr:DUF4358 domain-containing protein [Oscillospiraceae bacterium]
MKKTICFILATILCFCFASCGHKAEPPQVSLSTVMQEIRSSVSLPEMMDLTAENLQDYFGIEAGEITDFAACINANGYEKEEIILLCASDAASAESLVQKLNLSLENAAAEMQNYLPEQYALVQQSAVRTDGLIVSLCISENAQQIEAILDKYFK